jgi:hypothetical protein
MAPANALQEGVKLNFILSIPEKSVASGVHTPLVVSQRMFFVGGGTWREPLAGPRHVPHAMLTDGDPELAFRCWLGGSAARTDTLLNLAPC